MRDLVIMALAGEAPSLGTQPWLRYSGVGKINAALAVTEAILELKPQRIINMGTAGGLRVGPGLHRVTGFLQRDMDLRALGWDQAVTPWEQTPRILSLGCGGCLCATSDSFIAGDVDCLGADLVDMEAYALAKICWQKGVEFLCWKWVSDRADQTAGQDFSQQIAAGEPHYLEKLRELGLDIS